MMYSIDVSIVVDLPENPTEEEILNVLTQDLTRRHLDGTFDGAVEVNEVDE
jgi:hypothetical protein